MTEEWKLALNAQGEPYLLFDIANDPAETNNVVACAEHEPIRTELQLRLLRRIVSTPYLREPSGRG